MNKIILKSISIRNFKGIAKLDVSFDENLTVICGENGSGKSTIKNAWEWALCQNVEDFLPSLDNKEIDNLCTSVEVSLSVNDLDYVLRRESSPKYNKEKIKTGNEMKYSIDGIESGQKQYQSQIASIVGDGSFENLSMLTDKEFFNTDTSKWKWNNRRKILLSMTGAEQEANSIVENEEFESIKDYIVKGYSTSDIQSMFRKEKTALKDTLKSNQVLIDAKQKELDEYLGIDFEKISQELAVLKTKYTKLVNANKKENATEELNKLNDEILKCTQEVSALKTRDMLKIRDLEDFKLKIYREAIETKSKYDSVVKIINTDEIQLENLKKEDIKDVCSICGQKLPEDKIKEVLDKIKKEIETLETEIGVCKATAKIYYDKYNNLQTQYTEQDNKIKNFTPNEKIGELETRISELKSIIGAKKQSDLSNLSNQEQMSLQVRISDLEREMAKKDFLEKAYKQIKVWKQESLSVADKVIEVENKEIVLERFVKAQTEIVINKVNQFFSNGVSWSLYSTNYNGSLDEDCVCLYNNKRYSSLSTGERNTANMEVIKALQEFYDVNIPIFSDNSEANTIEYETDRQVIELYAKKGCKIDGCIKVTDLY